MDEPNEPRDRPVDAPPARASHRGGPYFGRLLIVLLLAVGFCAFMTWLLGSTAGR